MYSPPTPCTNPMQVVYVSKKHGFVTLYITATDKDECADWVANYQTRYVVPDTLSQVLQLSVEFVHIVGSIMYWSARMLWGT